MCATQHNGRPARRVTVARLRPAFGALLLTLAVAGCSSGSSGGTSPSPSASASASAATSSASAPASASASASAPASVSASESAPSTGAVQISIRNFAFAPVDITVQAGATITVMNEDSTAHTLTASDKSFDTGTIDAGKSSTFKAPAKSGSYPYACTIHPFMHGTLTVS